ncbi:MAG: hypothetical protein AAFY41_14070 [Bacteroidota bacterium]
MKIALNEIWNFLDLIDQSETGWGYSLVAGDVLINGITTEKMDLIKKGDFYDTELLPSIFTFREILWQPDVFTESSMSVPSLRILKAFCEETCQEYEEKDNPVLHTYIPLIKGIADSSAKAIGALDSERADVKKVLGDFRTSTFPIVKFFIYHPKNRHDYFQDAFNRLNYAVKVMLTQFYGRYTELKDPYWEITYAKPGKNSNASTEV